MSSDLPVLDGKTVIAILEKAGFEEVRVRGSHHIMKKPGHRFLISVPVHSGRTLAPGTFRNILRAAGLNSEAVRLLL